MNERERAGLGRVDFGGRRGITWLWPHQACAGDGAAVDFAGTVGLMGAVRYARHLCFAIWVNLNMEHVRKKEDSISTHTIYLN